LIEPIIKNKEVAFVGMAPNIYGKGLGEEIDSFDVVVRTNIYPVPQHLYIDYGIKCDIFSILKRPHFYKNIDKFVKAGGSAIFYYHSAVPIPKGIPCELIGKEERLRFREHIKKEMNGQDPKFATAGVTAYLICAKYKPKRFKYFGITGYQNLDGSLIDTSKTEPYIFYAEYEGNNKKRPKEKHKYHNHLVLNNYLRKLLREGKIEMDSYTEVYFK